LESLGLLIVSARKETACAAFLQCYCSAGSIHWLHLPSPSPYGSGRRVVGPLSLPIIFVSTRRRIQCAAQRFDESTGIFRIKIHPANNSEMWKMGLYVMLRSLSPYGSGRRVVGPLSLRIIFVSTRLRIQCAAQRFDESTGIFRIKIHPANNSEMWKMGLYVMLRSLSPYGTGRRVVAPLSLPIIIVSTRLRIQCSAQ